MSDTSPEDYWITISQVSDGSYVGRLESAEGDLWATIQQAPQERDQFWRSLLDFANRFGVPVRDAS